MHYLETRAKLRDFRLVLGLHVGHLLLQRLGCGITGHSGLLGLCLEHLNFVRESLVLRRQVVSLVLGFVQS